MNPTRLDTFLVSLAVGLTILLLCTRLFNYLQLQAEADQIHSNIQAIAETVHEFKEQTGQWFPQKAASEEYTFPDPFRYHHVATKYQGLEERWFTPGQNHGIIIQLVRFDSSKESRLTRHIFETALKNGEPYIRMLLHNRDSMETKSTVVMMLQNKLPAGTLAEINDHYFVVDIRELQDAE